jgi:hypothetical protein
MSISDQMGAWRRQRTGARAIKGVLTPQRASGGECSQPGSFACSSRARGFRAGPAAAPCLPPASRRPSFHLRMQDWSRQAAPDDAALAESRFPPFLFLPPPAPARRAREPRKWQRREINPQGDAGQSFRLRIIMSSKNEIPCTCTVPLSCLYLVQRHSSQGNSSAGLLRTTNAYTMRPLACKPKLGQIKA